MSLDMTKMTSDMTKKGPDMTKVNNYHDYFVMVAGAFRETFTFNPRLMQLSFGFLKYNEDGTLDISKLPVEGIPVPHAQLEAIATRIGSLELLSTCITEFGGGAKETFRMLSSHMINLHSLKIYLNEPFAKFRDRRDEQSVADIIFRSADLPNLRDLSIVSDSDKPATLKGPAFLDFLGHHPNITSIRLENVALIDTNGAGSVGRNMMSLIHELRQHPALQDVSITLCVTPRSIVHSHHQEHDGVFNDCTCVRCVHKAFHELALDLRLESQEGWIEFGEAVGWEHMPGARTGDFDLDWEDEWVWPEEEMLAKAQYQSFGKRAFEVEVI